MSLVSRCAVAITLFFSGASAGSLTTLYAAGSACHFGASVDRSGACASLDFFAAAPAGDGSIVGNLLWPGPYSASPDPFDLLWNSAIPDPVVVDNPAEPFTLSRSELLDLVAQAARNVPSPPAPLAGSLVSPLAGNDFGADDRILPEPTAALFFGAGLVAYGILGRGRRLR